MKKEINILNLEDDVDDAELIDRELHKGGFQYRFKRVVTQEDFLLALQEDRPDVILSDHALPTFNGFEALAVARNECPDVPFISVTGLMGDEKEIDTFERGAIDYVLKSRMSTLDRGGRVSSWNSGAEWITGHTAREIIGRHFSCFYPPEAVACGVPERALAQALLESHFEEEARQVRKGGARFWANVVITTL